MQKELDKNENKILKSFNNHHNKANEYLKEKEHRRRERRPFSQQLEDDIEEEAIRIAEILEQIERDRGLWEKWEEIENLRQPRRTRRRNP